MTEIKYPRDVQAALKGAESVLVLAPAAALAKGWHKKALPKVLAGHVDLLEKGRKPGRAGWTGSTMTGGKPARLALGLLPDEVSRHNSPARTEAIKTATEKAALGKGRKLVVACVDDRTHVSAVLAGVWRAFPRFDAKSGKGREKAGPVAFIARDRQGRSIPVDKVARAVAESGPWAAWMVDTPTADLDTATFVRRARQHVSGLDRVRTSVVVGEALLKEKLGGIHAVGRAALTAPRILILDYRPAKPRRTIALVGKGVVYDTGGLSLKVGGNMRTMKGDMGGAAAVVGAFRVLASTGCKDRIVAFAPLAENAVGPRSYRPDDILTMHSGLTVEIDNTDAEGRLLLADAVSLAARKYKPDLICDAATLTGAQLIATGQRHAAVVSNRAGLEDRARAAGRLSGDLTWPLPFAPEFYQAEFASRVADMKNSVKNRMNAQSSCAAQFVYRHIEDLDVPWLHVDMAGPSHRAERGTGFGVGLLVNVVNTLQAADLEADPA